MSATDRPLRRKVIRINREEEMILYAKTRRRQSSWIRRQATRFSRWLYEWAARP